MIARIIFLILIVLSGAQQSFSQAFDWVRSQQVPYSLNPSYPETPVWYNAGNNRVVNARIDTISYIYGSYTLGTTFVESRDTANGQVLWDLQLGDSAMIQRIVTDNNGNIYVGGLYQNTLHIGASDSLPFFTAPFTFQNTFILKLDGTGAILWKRNLTIDWPGYEGIEALAVAPSGNCWFALTDFFIAKIVEMDNSGVDQTVHTIENGKRIGNFSFDPWGGMYVSGAAQGGNFLLDGAHFIANSAYNMFIARYDTAGQPSWAYFGHDITFQKPMVVADASGNAFMAGLRFDTTSFNNMFFIHPYLSDDYFAFMMDSSGVAHWGLQQPALGLGPYGNFEPGSNLMVATDATGKYYLGGIHRGNVDWGNNFALTTSSMNDRKIGITCIDGSGKVKWEKLGGGDFTNYMHALTVSPSGSCYFTGSFSDTATFDAIVINTPNFYNFAVGKINPALGLGIPEKDESAGVVFPNPANDYITIPQNLLGASLYIYDAAGKLVKQTGAVHSDIIDIRDLATGVYTLELNKPQTIARFRVMVMK